MDWTEIRIHTSSEAVEAVSYFLHESGLEGVVIEDREVLTRDWDTPFGEIVSLTQTDYPKIGVVIKAYLPSEEDATSMLLNINDYLDDLPAYGLDPGPKEITTKRIKYEEWAESWKQNFHLFQATDRLTIKPVWETYQPQKSNEIVIELDPGLAFGTGHHVTTLQCLNFLETYLSPQDHVIDVGCGSGILSIAAAKLGADQVFAIDLDPVAVREAQKHKQLNQVDDVLQVFCSDGLTNISQRANLIVANLLAEILVPLIEHLPRVLSPSGYFIAAGILHEKAAHVIQLTQQVGLQLCETNHQGDWVAFVAKKW